MDETSDSTVVTLGQGGSSTGQEQEVVEVKAEDLQLISRLVLGLLIFGGEELLSRLRSVQQRIQISGDLAAGDIIPDDETMVEVLGYLAVGVVMRGQKRVAGILNRGLRLSMNAAGWALSTAGRVTDNRLARPFRQPVERRVWGLVMEGQSAIQEGRREVYASRTLADATLEEIIEEAIQTLAENPELTVAIQRVLAGQGVSMTGTLVGNTRQLSLSADDLTEGMLRRMLRRKPRQEMPPSLLAGKPLTMYDPRKPEQGALDDGE